MSPGGIAAAAAKYDASLTAPGAQMVEVAPGKKDSASPVEGHTAALGKLFKMEFDKCAEDPAATASMIRHSER